MLHAHIHGTVHTWQLSALSTSSIVGRDEEDGRKLQAGIQIAIDKGVLEEHPAVRVSGIGCPGVVVVVGLFQSDWCPERFRPMPVQVEPIARIEVMGKSADQVVEEVLQQVGNASGGKAGKVPLNLATNCVVCLYVCVLTLEMAKGVEVPIDGTLWSCGS